MLTSEQITDYKYFRDVENWSKAHLTDLVSEMQEINKKNRSDKKAV